MTSGPPSSKLYTPWLNPVFTPLVSKLRSAGKSGPRRHFSITKQYSTKTCWFGTGWQKKTLITDHRITSKISFRLTQNFSYIRSSLCSRHLQSFKSLLQKLFVSLALKKCVPDELPALQAHLDPAGKVLDDPPAFLPNCTARNAPNVAYESLLYSCLWEWIHIWAWIELVLKSLWFV